MNDQKTLIEDLICFGSSYDLESCSLAAKVIVEQENLIRKLREQNEELHEDLRKAELERAKAETSKPYTANWAFCPNCGGSLDTGWECVKCGADWRWSK